MISFEQILVLLNKLEKEEEKFLSWGFVDGGFSDKEIEEKIELFIEEEGLEINNEDLLIELIDKKLLFDFNYQGKKIWRTRMGETVRLLSKLKQLFHRDNFFERRIWETSPTLVADFRFALRPRTYPRRDIPIKNVVEELEKGNGFNELQKGLLTELLKVGKNRFMELSRFQLNAIKSIHRDSKKKKTRGTIICSGTGTGKTLSFYIPAFINIANLLEEKEFWTKAVALYPRNELLKDQFSEIFRETQKLTSFLRERKGRGITLGTFFGMTPISSNSRDIYWEKKGDGFLCPFLRCPLCNDDTLVWKNKNIKSNREILSCITPDCNFESLEGELVLTRKNCVKNPPDILFSTTEMLNRRITDNEFRKVFGIGKVKSPKFLLLDEVHTYTGVHGAQVANLIRRWKNSIGNSVQIVGLSATLEDATNFFSQLTGIYESYISEITPAEKELIHEGMEYLIALRGDPVSATSLLSTSIQTGMLLRRVMDHKESQPEDKIFGDKIFLFTDDLDVTNRFFHNMRDAEGYNFKGNPIKPPLAILRSSNKEFTKERLKDGQCWQIVEKIHEEFSSNYLDRPLFITRTSSQDRGAHPKSDIIIATASLEVGYNDPGVGAIIQHKAPLNMASFLQRKGRAGRRRTMRPWTVLVLSDYGRDRIAYQGYDQLFNPILEKQTLPVLNRYVLRMQAIFSFMDWVAKKMEEKGFQVGSVWDDFAGKLRKNKHMVEERHEFQIELIEGVLKESNVRDELMTYISKSLQIPEEEVRTILWEPPRSVIREALPTLLRRLKTKWGTYLGGREISEDLGPLPEFVPENLFSDLNLPEVKIIISKNDKKMEQMPIIQAIRTFAPGKVTKRFGVKRFWDNLWIEPKEKMPIEDYCKEFDELGNFQVLDEGKVKNFRCIRPRVFQPKAPPKTISDRSNSEIIWNTQIFPSGEGFELNTPVASKWEKIIKGIDFFIHRNKTYAIVRRFSLKAKANIIKDKGQEVEKEIFFNNDGEHYAVGFSQESDGIRISFELENCFLKEVIKKQQKNGNMGYLRNEYFHFLIQNSKNLNGLANKFQRDWLVQIFMSIILQEALSQEKDLRDICHEIKGDEIAKKAEQVLETIFQSLEIESFEEVEELENRNQQFKSEKGEKQKVHKILLKLFENEKVVDELKENALKMWQKEDNNWVEWVKNKTISTLGSAILDACLQLSTHYEAGDLFLDIDSGPKPQKHKNETQEIWITETTSGGGGAIEEIIKRYSEDPRRFFRLVESSLQGGDFERIDYELKRLLFLAKKDYEIKERLSQFRNAGSYQEQKREINRLTKKMVEKGILPTHPVVSAIFSRILKPASSSESDDLLYNIIKLWEEKEQELGIEIDSRVFAYIVSRKEDLTRVIPHIDQDKLRDKKYVFNVINSLLWPRGSLIRSKELMTYNPFKELPKPDRELLLTVIKGEEVEVSIEEINFKEIVVQNLKKEGLVKLFAKSTMQKELKRVILEFSTQPLEIDFLHLFPRIDGIYRTPKGFYVYLDIREAIQ